jgi:arylsulfotransferase ASST
VDSNDLDEPARILTRRGFVAAAAGTVAALATGPIALAAPAAARRFVTQPAFDPPLVNVRVPAEATADGLIFVAPFGFGTEAIVPGRYGPLILDDAGEPVWFLPLSKILAQNFQVQRYRGQPVLTWYEAAGATYGGSWVVYDASYRELHRIHAGHKFSGDLHEFLITSENTALLAIYNEVRTDLRPVGGPVDGRVVEGIVQELDLRSKRVLLEWHSLDHVPVTESYRTEATPAGNVDYLHLNSIAVDPLDGHLLVSARHTSTVYKLDRKTGAVKWRLGGKKSDFAIDAEAVFNFQHDARRHQDGTLTLFANGATGTGDQAVEPFSRGLRLAIDERTRTARLVTTYEAGEPRLAIALGDVQQLADGGVFVGWGSAGPFSEFDSRGSLRFDAAFADGSVSYRARRFAWSGRPAQPPAVAVRSNGDGTLTVHASWNGATDVTQWLVRGGPSRNRLRPLHTSRRRGFETAITFEAAARYVAVTALDAHGSELDTSPTIAV